jgi:hypothetical protein
MKFRSGEPCVRLILRQQHGHIQETMSDDGTYWGKGPEFTGFCQSIGKAQCSVTLVVCTGPDLSRAIGLIRRLPRNKSSWPDPISRHPLKSMWYHRQLQLT